MQAFLAEVQAFLDILRDEQVKLARLREAISTRRGVHADESVMDVKQWEIVVKHLEVSLAEIVRSLEEGRYLNASASACILKGYVQSVLVSGGQLTGLAGHIYGNLRPLMVRLGDALARLCQA